MKKLIPFLMTIFLAAAPVFAEALVKKQVSASANWLVHTDYEQFNNSKIGRLFRERLEELGVEEKLANFARIFSFHPLDDVRGVTIYGQGQGRKKAVALIEARFDKEVLLAFLRLNESHKEIEYGDHIVHSWLDQKKRDPNSIGKMTYGSFYNDKLIVMGADPDAVKLAIDVLDDSAENAEASGAFSQVKTQRSGVFLLAMVDGVSEMAKQPHAAVLKQTDKLSLEAGEADGNVYIDFGLTACSEQAAENIEQIAEGLIALGTLAGQKQPKLAELAENLKLSRKRSNIQVNFESDAEMFFSLLKGSNIQVNFESDAKMFFSPFF